MSAGNSNQFDPASDHLVLTKARFFEWLRPAILHAQQHSVEAPWYTVWNIVFLAIGLASGPKDSIHTLVAPQLAVVRRFESTPRTREYIQRVIPDFILAYYWRITDGPPELRRGIDLIVEIKHPLEKVKTMNKAKAAHATIIASLDQVKLQVRHAFDECPGQNHLWALVICGLHWVLFEFERGDMSPELSKKRRPQTRSQAALAPQAAGQLPPEEGEIDPAYLPEATYTSMFASGVHPLLDNLDIESSSPSLSNAFRVMVDVVWKDERTNMTASKPAWLAPDPNLNDPDGSKARSNLLHIWADDLDVAPSAQITDIDETSSTTDLISNDELPQLDTSQSNLGPLRSPFGLVAQTEGKKRPPPSPSPSPSRAKRLRFRFDAANESAPMLTMEREERQPEIPPNNLQPAAEDEMPHFPSAATTTVSGSLRVDADVASTPELLAKIGSLEAEVDRLQARLRAAGLSSGESP